MNKGLIERIDALAEKATGGEWVAMQKPPAAFVDHGWRAMAMCGQRWMVGAPYDEAFKQWDNEAHAHLIAALRNAWPDIKAELSRLQSERDEAQALCDKSTSEHLAFVSRLNDAIRTRGLVSFQEVFTIYDNSLRRAEKAESELAEEKAANAAMRKTIDEALMAAEEAGRPEYEYLAKSINALRAQLEERWIPVTERLPELTYLDDRALRVGNQILRPIWWSDEVLVETASGRRRLAEMVAREDKSDAQWYAARDVVRWMRSGIGSCARNWCRSWIGR